jgi:phospholipid/cholesterol/gamma-HCH transport system substrate-binding protein
MKLKFNKYERAAGLFIILAFTGVIMTALSAAIKQGWFEPKVVFHIVLTDADGIHQGTIVQMAGLRVGAVESVDLESENKIRVSFYVLGKFQDKIRENSVIQLVRPFIIGERAIDISVGSQDLPMAVANSTLVARDSFDIMSFLSGKNMNDGLLKLGEVVESLQVLLNAFADKSRAESLVRVIDRLDPLMKNLDNMTLQLIKFSRQATDDESFHKLVKNLALTTQEMNKILPEMNKQNPEIAKDLASMMKSLAIVTNALGPAVKGVEMELPGAGQRLVEALDESVIVLKAMQKSYFLQSSVKEVRSEEAKARLPAGKK